jgi:DNA-binding GntR family transcriptional regulator
LVWVQLADLITARILDGTYPEESRLPSEIALQQETGAARETIRQAIAELRKRGLIETVAGKGSFVLPESERSPQA